MGYTHYWERPNGHEDRDAFRRLGTDTKRIIAKAVEFGIAVGDAFGEGEPEFTEKHFAFNGAGDQSFETFWWDSKAVRAEWSTEDTAFGFTKTNYRPYDAVVTAVLIRAKEIYGDAVEVFSDGSWDDWESGRNLYAIVFGETPSSPFAAEPAQ